MYGWLLYAHSFQVKHRERDWECSYMILLSIRDQASMAETTTAVDGLCESCVWLDWDRDVLFHYSFTTLGKIRN